MNTKRFTQALLFTGSLMLVAAPAFAQEFSYDNEGVAQGFKSRAGESRDGLYLGSSIPSGREPAYAADESPDRLMYLF